MKRTNLRKIGAAIVAGAALILFQAASIADKTSSGKLAMSDENFVLTVAQGGMTEVKLGELAQQKGMRDDVKKFGEHMVTDHSKANAELKALASAKEVTIPDQLDAAHAGDVDRLSKLEGDQFDKAYIESMVKDHKTTVSIFEDESKMTKDADLKSFVDKTLPTLKKHLSHIEKIEAAKQ